MEETLTIHVEDFYGLSTATNTVDSSGKPKSAKPFFSGQFLRTMLAEVGRAINTLVEEYDVSNSINDPYEIKEKEFEELVGKEKFQSLDKELRDFLINAAGMFDLGFPVDIKKAYKYSIFDDES